MTQNGTLKAGGDGSGAPDVRVTPRHLRQQALIASLFSDAVVVETCDPRDAPPSPFAEETAGLSPNAVDKRRREFAAGRAAAHRAMERLGQPAVPILIGPKRAPIWPTGIIGSISHCGIAAAAALCHQPDCAALGVDLEEDLPLSDDLIPQICRPAEREWLQQQINPGQLAKVIFSAKEAAYKCQYHQSETFFGFDGMELEMTLDNPGSGRGNGSAVSYGASRRGRFVARFTADRPPFRRGDGIAGQFAIGEGLIATATQLPLV
ncbi:4'-phosphopantetheinyl transferase [Phaeobacter sp.]|uniref:4'-phosphopantetheinyl transferase family protein n=1 Tax=Phaeobacter sp. TaxID=1902409 RepID=UPI0025D3337B|nr:4'-phosphopantetheinyl transferase superfamily protein [Phaeobacter sp.]